MKKRYIGISATKEPRVKGKHAKPIIVLEVAKISYTENLSVDEYNTQLCDGFNAWLLEAYSNRPKGCNPIWQEGLEDAAK